MTRPGRRSVTKAGMEPGSAALEADILPLGLGDDRHLGEGSAALEADTSPLGLGDDRHLGEGHFASSCPRPSSSPGHSIFADVHIEGSQPEWCISTIYHA